MLDLQIAIGILEAIVDINIVKAELLRQGLHHAVCPGYIFVGAHFHARIGRGGGEGAVDGIIGHHVDHRVGQLRLDDFADLIILFKEIFIIKVLFLFMILKIN